LTISDLITLLTGVSLFLFGMTLMGDGLKRVSGNKLEPILFRLSGTPLRGMLLGTGVTAVIQSSSATSVMVVGFVNAGMMKVRQAISVILGAILGTSITGWVICLSYLDNMGGLASLLSTVTLTGVIAVTGIVLRMFSKKPIHHHIGDIMLGFAVLMVGMSSMSGAVRGLGDQPWFTSLLTTLTNPIIGILVGLVFSAVLQSASAAVGIVQALSATGSMTLSSALPLLMGITIGASVPVLLSALGAKPDGKRTAFSYLIASFMGVMIVASLFYIANAIFRFPFMDQIMNPFSLAFVNTVLRMAILCLLAPFTDVLEALAKLLVRSDKKESNPTLRLEERFLEHPALAIEQCRLTICDMARDTEKAIDAVDLLTHYSEAGFNRIEEMENAGDQYEDALGSYLVRLTAQELTERQGRMASVFLHSLTDFERISDRALNIARSASEIHEKRMTFSDEALHELGVLISAIRENVHITMDAFIKADQTEAQRVEPLEQVIDRLCDELRRRHVDRLQHGKCTITQGFVFNDLIGNFRRISDHCSNIAAAMIGMESGSLETHEYLGKLKEEKDRSFQQTYEHYTQQFSL
jgi:phosphate:Na+ symporter